MEEVQRAQDAKESQCSVVVGESELGARERHDGVGDDRDAAGRLKLVPLEAHNVRVPQSLDMLPSTSALDSAHGAWRKPGGRCVLPA